MLKRTSWNKFGFFYFVSFKVYFISSNKLLLFYIWLTMITLISTQHMKLWRLLNPTQLFSITSILSSGTRTVHFNRYFCVSKPTAIKHNASKSEGTRERVNTGGMKERRKRKENSERKGRLLLNKFHWHLVGFYSARLAAGRICGPAVSEERRAARSTPQQPAVIASAGY